MRVVYDAKYAAHMVSSEWPPDKNIALVDLVTEMVAILQSAANVEFRHVYSHLGDPWNELADAGAAAFSTGKLQSHFLLPPYWHSRTSGSFSQGHFLSSWTFHRENSSRHCRLMGN